MITDHEKRIKDAIDKALAAESTEATCDIGDLLALLEQVHSARKPKETS